MVRLVGLGAVVAESVVDDDVVRVEQVSSHQYAARLPIPPPVLRKRLHLLECVLDDDEALPGRHAVDQVHGDGSSGARQ